MLCVQMDKIINGHQWTARPPSTASSKATWLCKTLIGMVKQRRVYVAYIMNTYTYKLDSSRHFTFYAVHEGSATLTMLVKVP